MTVPLQLIQDPPVYCGHCGSHLDLAAPPPHPLLSPRELEVVSLIATGMRNKEVGKLMFISEQTVKNHLHHIFAKLGLADRLSVALWAISNGCYRKGETKCLSI